MNFTKEVAPLVEALNEGKLILYPTETIWGIGCDATNAEAVKKIDALKKRKEGKNYILLVDNESRLSEYVAYIPPKASNLIAYHTRPLTIVYDKPKNLPDSLLAEDGSIAIRVTLDPFCKELVNAFGKPIVSTSANISGKPYPKTFLDIDNAIKRGVASIAQYKQYEESENAPSVVVKVVDGEDLIFLRK
ncbi:MULTISPECIES: L-threonylcarbamoyladenylate synthase [unclassified Aureispira]|uniref:L-threonylcarbamoyladenylate synthase n=1 Tax=unclassified Aureispira TaxID=2649989 RepID=UPI000695C043|nr:MULTISPECIES: L-threonylcarbamoyladenylate synthase [unclassified Aureispira]WMX12568.1 L-threonylcarbamoyladenylate synthase [Aureispira sp. CCB-E]